MTETDKTALFNYFQSNYLIQLTELDFIEINKIINRVSDNTPTLELWPSFKDFWDLYDKKVGNDESKKKWNKLKQKDKEEIMAYLPLYLQSKPDKTYRLNPFKFINNKTWHDEIIIATPKQQTRFDIEEQRRNSVDELQKRSIEILIGKGFN